MKNLRLFEEFVNESEIQKVYLLNSKTNVNVETPIKNEFISGWEDSGDKNTYILVKARTYENPIIVSGSGAPSDYDIDKNGSIILIDDGNKTTKFPRDKYGVPGKILAIAHGMDEIKDFPKGKYALMVMK